MLFILLLTVMRPQHQGAGDSRSAEIKASSSRWGMDPVLSACPD